MGPHGCHLSNDKESPTPLLPSCSCRNSGESGRLFLEGPCPPRPLCLAHYAPCSPPQFSETTHLLQGARVRSWQNQGVRSLASEVSLDLGRRVWGALRRHSLGSSWLTCLALRRRIKAFPLGGRGTKFSLVLSREARPLCHGHAQPP